jgi:DNA-binding beta-propeller fold protein YncE
VRGIRLVVVGFSATIALAIAGDAAAAFTLVPGNVYTSDSSTNTILQLDSSGLQVGSLTVPGATSGVRGMAFGPDGTMYVVIPFESGFKVLLLNSQGNVRGEYSGPSYIAGNITYGKIAVAGNRFYVAGADNLVAFDRFKPAATVIYQENQLFDVLVMPAGNLLVASAYRIDEVTSAGAQSVPN